MISLTLFPGTIWHELTSHFAFDPVFKFFDEKIKLAPNTGSDVSEDSEQEGDASSQNNMFFDEDSEITSCNNMDDIDPNSQTKVDNTLSQPDDCQMETDI